MLSATQMRFVIMFAIACEQKEKGVKPFVGVFVFYFQDVQCCPGVILCSKINPNWR